MARGRKSLTPEENLERIIGLIQENENGIKNLSSLWMDTSVLHKSLLLDMLKNQKALHSGHIDSGTPFLCIKVPYQAQKVRYLFMRLHDF